MKRRIFHVATALSALMLMVLLVLTVRGIFVTDILEKSSWGSSDSWWLLSVQSRCGELVFVDVRNSGLILNQITPQLLTRKLSYRRTGRIYDAHWYWPILGIHSRAWPAPNATTWENVYISVPDWMLIVAAGILPMVWWARWRQMRLRRKGLCLNCGYDLRASSERCPECGTEIPRPVSR